MLKIRLIIISFFIVILCGDLSAAGYLSANYFYSNPSTSETLTDLVPGFCCYPNYNEIKTRSNGVSFAYLQRVNKWYLFGASVGYSCDKTEFSSYEKTTLGIDGILMNAVILSRINAKSDIFHFALDFAVFEVYENLFITGSFNYRISGNTNYNKYEELVEPENQGVFKETQTRFRNQSDSTLSGAFQSYGLACSIKYLFPINEAFDSENELYIAPQIEYTYSMSKFYKSEYWYSGAFILKLGLQYGL